MRAKTYRHLVLIIICLFWLLWWTRPLEGISQAATDTGDVRILVTITDRQGLAIKDLKSEELLVYENKKLRQVDAVKSPGEEPLAVGLLIDASGSRRDQLPRGEREGARRLLAAITQQGASGFIESFTGDVALHTELTKDLASLLTGLELALPSRPWGPSSPYVAIMQACEKILSQRPGRKVLIITTDGVDNSDLQQKPKGDTRRMDARLVTKTLLQTNSVLYVILLSDPADSWSKRERERGIAAMSSIAEQSGGRSIVVRSVRALTAAFDLIALEIDSQMFVTFTPRPSSKPGEFREIRVTTTRKDVLLSAPSGYFAPAK